MSNGENRMIRYNRVNKQVDSISFSPLKGRYYGHGWSITPTRICFLDVSNNVISVFTHEAKLLYSFTYNNRFKGNKYFYFAGIDNRKSTFSMGPDGYLYMPIPYPSTFDKKELKTTFPLLGKMDSTGHFTKVFVQCDSIYLRNNLAQYFDLVSFYVDHSDSLIYVSQPLSENIEVYNLDGERVQTFGARGKYMNTTWNDLLAKDLGNGEDSVVNKARIESSFYAGIYATDNYVIRLYHIAGEDSSDRMTPKVTPIKELVKVKGNKKQRGCPEPTLQEQNQEKILFKRPCFLQVYRKTDKQLVFDSRMDITYLWIAGHNGNTLYLEGNTTIKKVPGFWTDYLFQLDQFH